VREDLVGIEDLSEAGSLLEERPRGVTVASGHHEVAEEHQGPDTQGRCIEVAQQRPESHLSLCAVTVGLKHRLAETQLVLHWPSFAQARPQRVDPECTTRTRLRSAAGGFSNATGLFVCGAYSRLINSRPCQLAIA